MRNCLARLAIAHKTDMFLSVVNTMPRSDRLDHLIQLLSDGTPHRASDLARATGVSDRTIWRDMDRLRDAGIAVEGTRGTGYRLTSDIALPPLNLSMAELEALHLALAILAESGDPDLGPAATSLSAKVDAVLEERPDTPTRFGQATTAGFVHIQPIRSAIQSRQKLLLTQSADPHRIRPLALDYRARLWICTAWDETQSTFARFRLDKIQSLATLPDLYVDEPGKTLEDMHILPRFSGS